MPKNAEQKRNLIGCISSKSEAESALMSQVFRHNAGCRFFFPFCSYSELHADFPEFLIKIFIRFQRIMYKACEVLYMTCEGQVSKRNLPTIFSSLVSRDMCKHVSMGHFIRVLGDLHDQLSPLFLFSEQFWPDMLSIVNPES